MERTLPKSSSELRSHIRNDARLGRKRDLGQDCQLDVSLLRQKGYSFEVDYDCESIPDLPTVFALNHYSRPIWIRRTSTTTSDVILFTEAATVQAEQLTNRAPVFIMQVDVSDKLLKVIPSVDRQTQLAAALVYDVIKVKKKLKGKKSKPDNQYNPLKESALSISQGKNLFVIPEGKSNGILQQNTLQQYDRSFPIFIRQLMLEVTPFQIVPVSVYARGKNFYARFGNPIRPEGSPQEIAKNVMVAIAGGLPVSLRGVYQEEATQQKPFTTPGELESVSDQKYQPGEHQSSSVESSLK